MTLHVNGKPLDLPEGSNVAQLLEKLGTGAKRVAVEVNKELVIKKEWEAKVLREGDQVEVVTFVGGG
ncbi:MAG: sulfur carrier protein ThiS [Planctomycetota bacterium]|nr:sulfur carrier protein ThiS [Planctomycetota bacterium]